MQNIFSSKNKTYKFFSYIDDFLKTHLIFAVFHTKSEDNTLLTESYKPNKYDLKFRMFGKCKINTETKS